MQLRRILLTSSAFVMLGAGAAWATCVEDLAALQAETGAATEESASTEGEGIAKDGSLAPLQEAEEASADEDLATTETSGEPEAEAEEREGIAKDGSLAPLQEEEEAGEGGDAPAIALSQQDAEAQQQGGAPDLRTDALTRAQAALDAGDEAGCMAALEEARSL